MADAAEKPKTFADVAPFLAEPVTLGGLELKNRVAFASLTRGRAGHERVPNDALVEYYSLRAGQASLLLTEASALSAMGEGWAQSASIYTPEHVQGWKRVVDAVHAKGSFMGVQLWFIGRAGHSSFMPDNQQIVAPSAVAIEGDGVYNINDEKVPHEVPRALEIEEIQQIVADVKHATTAAREAGFDFVELHLANGYLMDQFLQSCSNKRTDQYGGSFENRFRIADEALQGMLEVYPANRIGVKISPNGAFNGMGSEDNIEAFTYYIQRLNSMNLGYIQIMDGTGFGFHNLTRRFTLFDVKKNFDGLVIGNVGFDMGTADGAIRTGACDLVTFGRPFISNPDLVDRWTHGIPLTPPNPATWFTHDVEGYTTYRPASEAAEATAA